jgi:hypothetical protein
VRIVFDHPGRQVRSVIGRWIGRLAGSLFVFIGLAATVIAIPSGFVVVADVVNRFQAQPENLFEPGFPLRQIEAAFFAAVLTAILGLRYGRRLFRGRRSIVLFLRRFGYDGAMQVVTYAVAETVGVAWRLVTLDDDEIAPIGVDTASRVVFGTGEKLVRLAGIVWKLVITILPWSIWGMCAVVALQVLVVWPDWRQLLEDGTVDRYTVVFASVMERRLPIRYVDLSLPGAFALLATGLVLGLAGLLVMFVALLAMIPLFGFVILATSSAEAVRKAEQQKQATISQAHEVTSLARELSVRGSQTFAPRLIVVRVAPGIWHETVSALVAAAAATIVDVSEPTENLVWELTELKRLGGHDRCIFIVDHARLDDAGNFRPGAAGGFAANLAILIGERPVLAYTTDRAGMRRFARALHGQLLDLPQAGRVPSSGPGRELSSR